MLKRIRTATIVATGLLFFGEARAQTYTNVFNLTFSRPLWMEEIPTKPEHYLVLEQGGTVQVVKREGNAWTKTEFLKITVTGGKSGADEQGLLGFAFHPQFATNRKYYVYYVTSTGGLSNVIDERLADATLLKDSGTQPRQILKIQDFANNHNGGTIRFGKDGYLYIGTGDGGGGGDPNRNGQNKNALLAKFLRIDVNKQDSGKAYAIPADNPFASGGGAPEVWAYGLRNPYKWAFDPVTGDLWAADVGQSTMEEVDIVEKGGNYGWNISEGTNKVSGDIKGPVWAYRYGASLGTCIIGGYVFRGNPSSKYYGQFVVGDYGTRNVWAVKAIRNDSGTSTQLARAPAPVFGWGTDTQGRLYLTDSTTIHRLEGPDWNPASVSLIPRDGNLKQAIGHIFSCRPGSRLADAAFAAGTELEILSLTGERQGAVHKATREAPASLKAGVYILRAQGVKGVKPNLLMVK